jgi:hypothetical protein
MNKVAEFVQKNRRDFHEAFGTSKLPLRHRALYGGFLALNAVAIGEEAIEVIANDHLPAITPLNVLGVAFFGAITLKQFKAPKVEPVHLADRTRL